MNALPIPIAATPHDIEVGALATRNLYTPGFLIPPEVLKLASGLDIVQLAGEIRQDGNNDLLLPLSSFLFDYFSIDLSREEFSTIQHQSIEGFSGQSHSDALYEDLAFWICGPTRGDEPREIEMATVHRPVVGISLSLEGSVPFNTSVFGGAATLGWGACFLSKQVTSVDDDKKARTAHKFSRGGSWARFGKHDARGLRLKQQDGRTS